MGRVRVLLSLLVAASFAVGGLAAAAEAGSGASGPARGGNGFVKHQGTNWVWFGPRNWDAVYSPYGITIFGSPQSGSTIDYGGSSILCDGEPKQHFAGQRNAFASNPNLKQVRFRKVSNVKRTGSTYSQTMNWTARANGTNIGGTLGFQYAASLGGFCYGASLYKATIDNRSFRSSMKTIEAVWDRTAYVGPGLVINPNTGLP